MAAATFFFTGQVVQCSMGSIRRGVPMHHSAAQNSRSATRSPVRLATLCPAQSEAACRNLQGRESEESCYTSDTGLAADVSKGGGMSTGSPERHDGQRPPENDPADHEPAGTGGGLLSNLTVTIGGLMLKCKLEIERIEAASSALEVTRQAQPRIRDELLRLVRLVSSASSHPVRTLFRARLLRACPPGPARRDCGCRADATHPRSASGQPLTRPSGRRSGRWPSHVRSRPVPG